MGPKEREIKRRLGVLEHAEKIGNVRMTCSYFDLARSTFYRWKKKYDKHGESGLGRKSTAAKRHPRAVPAEIYDLAVHPWVFMTNHIHLLVTPGADDTVSNCMQYLGRYYVRYFNFQYSRTGTL